MSVLKQNSEWCGRGDHVGAADQVDLDLIMVESK